MPDDLLARTRVVLVEPMFPENVGSVARALSNLGMTRLIIAGSPGMAADRAARRLAVAAGHILDAAVQVADFDEAVAGAALVLGTTAHEAYETWRLLDPWEALDLAVSVPGEVALVFGSERYGLGKALLRRCDQVMHLPTESGPRSLNLAQAVLLVAWEWYQAGTGRLVRPTPRAAGADQPAPDLGPYWLAVLERAGALKPHNRAKREATLRRILSRVRLSREEADLLRGIGSKLALLLGLR